MSKRSEELVTDFEQKVRNYQRREQLDLTGKADDETLEWSRKRLVKYILELERQVGII